MTDKNSGERKKLSLSLEGKLSLKNSFNSKLTGSITTNSRSGRNTVQVEVKRAKRVHENRKDDLKKIEAEVNQNLSAEEISSRSKMLKEDLARTAARAENKAIEEKEKNNSLEDNQINSATLKDTIESPKSINKVEERNKNINFGNQKNEKIDDNLRNIRKVADKDIFRENNKKNINKGYEQKRQGKLTIARALDGDNIRVRSLASIKRRREKVRMQAENVSAVKQVREVIVPDTIMVSELANRMSEKTADVVRELMKNGIMATATQVIDADTAELITSEFGHKVKRVSESDVELNLLKTKVNKNNLVSRPPIVTVMGHVDHGKTSLLDALRQTKVADGEAGGITQHIGAYQIKSKNNNVISFIDTPGHEAFSEMRARGANLTDIVVLVVAADDGVNNQTIEAIKHAKAASVPIIVAINKCDKPDSDPQKVRNELLQQDLIPEEMGGDIQCINISAKNKTGLNDLIESIELQAELLELKSDENCPAEGIVIEAKTEKGKGSVITLLVKSGTLSVGNILVVGSESGKVRALINDLGKNVDFAKPSTPIEVLGLSGVPNSGDLANVVESDAKAREIAEYRSRKFKKKKQLYQQEVQLNKCLQIFNLVRLMNCLL